VVRAQRGRKDSMRGTGPEGRTPQERPANTRKVLPRVVLGVGVVCVVVLVLVFTGWGASLWEVFSDRERLQRVLEGAGALAPLLFVALLVVQAVVAPLPAPALAIVGGYGFGVLEGFFLTWLGSLIGGVISFALSRRFGRGFVAGSARAARLDRFMEEHGAILIFVLRLIPLVSFDAISYAAGLSSIRFRAFLLATALGMMPGTFAFVYVGGSGSGLRTWAVLLGLAVLAAGAYVFQRRFFKASPRVR
jgi:uncharacterized membrane protein YdjX (TVP38/TMEM64 family)